MQITTSYSSAHKLLLSAILLFAATAAQGLDVSGSLSLKTKYLGKLGTTADNDTVLQPYVEANHASGMYGYIWFNLPLKAHNPSRSLEFEPSVGYRTNVGKWKVDASLTLFDIQNPRVFDFKGDILSPKIKASRNGYYTEYLQYIADRGKDGFLVEVGKAFKPTQQLAVSVNVTYVDGPFHFEPIVYARFKAKYQFASSAWQVSLDVLDLVEREASNEQRRDRVAVGLHYAF